MQVCFVVHAADHTMPLRCIIISWQDARHDSEPFPNRIQMAVGCKHRVHVTVTRSIMAIVSRQVAGSTSCLSAIYVVVPVGQLESYMHFATCSGVRAWDRRAAIPSEVFGRRFGYPV
jgi:hypothetical protein